MKPILLSLFALAASAAFGQGEIKIHSGGIETYHELAESSELVEVKARISGTVLNLAFYSQVEWKKCQSFFEHSLAKGSTMILEVRQGSASNGDTVLGCGRSILNRPDLMEILLNSGAYLFDDERCVIKRNPVAELVNTERYVLWCKVL